MRFDPRPLTSVADRQDTEAPPAWKGLSALPLGHWTKVRKPQPPHSPSGGAGKHQETAKEGTALPGIYGRVGSRMHTVWVWSRQPGSHPQLCFSLTCALGRAPPSLCLGFPTCNMALSRPPGPLWSPSPHAVRGLAQSSSPSRGLPTSVPKQDLGRGWVGALGLLLGVLL